MKTVILKLILQLSLCLFLNKNKRKTQKANDGSKLTYPSNWIPSPLYYYIEDGIKESPIKDALDRFQRESCLRFSRISKDSVVQNMEGFAFLKHQVCITDFGKNSSKTFHKIYLNRNCSRESAVGLIQKYIGRALGMPEQHRRPDRDNYISVNETGIYGRLKERLTKYSSSNVHLYGVGYDFDSLFQLESTAFRFYSDTTPTFNGKPPKYNAMMGQTEGFSFADYKLLNYHYCNSSYSKFFKKMPDCKNGGFYDVNSSKERKCKCPNGFVGKMCQNLRKILKIYRETQEYNATPKKKL